MSTNRLRVYTKEDLKLAQEAIKKSEKYFTRKTNRRRTVQVRIGEKWHRRIKKIAGEEKIMISFFLDRMCDHFFKHY